MESSQVILIIAAPGNLQAGLQVLLGQLAGVEILVVADGKSALGAVKRHSPSLVILDSDIDDHMRQMVFGQIKSQHPGICCLSLVNHVDERDEVLISGADAAIVKGYPAARLLNVIKGLLADGDMTDTKPSVGRSRV
jgi:DNA-binding response OmpR family regulator